MMTGVWPGDRGVVLPSTTIALAKGARETATPWIVAAGAPATTFWPSIANPGTALRVVGCELMVTIGPAPAFAGFGIGEVMPLTTTAEADGARETT